MFHSSRQRERAGGFSERKWRVGGLILPIVAAVLVMAAGPKTSRAQCPDGSWYDLGTLYTFQIPGTTCTFQVGWCTKVVDDTIKTWVYELIPDSSSACDSISNLELIRDAGEIIDSFSVAEFWDGVIGSCPDSFVVVQSYLAPCWSANGIVRTGREKSWGLFPCFFTAACYRQCKFCYDLPTGIARSDCFTTDPNESVSCGPPAPSGNSWNWGMCFTVGCLWLPPAEKQTQSQAPIPLDETLRLFPNPAAQSVTVASSEIGTNVEILDVLGRNVISGIIPKNGQLTLDVSSLPNGAYYVSEGQTEIRFIKN